MNALMGCCGGFECPMSIEDDWDDSTANVFEQSNAANDAGTVVDFVGTSTVKVNSCDGTTLASIDQSTYLDYYNSAVVTSLQPVIKQPPSLEISVEIPWPTLETTAVTPATYLRLQTWDQLAWTPTGFKADVNMSVDIKVTKFYKTHQQGDAVAIDYDINHCTTPGTFLPAATEWPWVFVSRQNGHYFYCPWPFQSTSNVQQSGEWFRINHVLGFSTLDTLPWVHAETGLNAFADSGQHTYGGFDEHPLLDFCYGADEITFGIGLKFAQVVYPVAGNNGVETKITFLLDRWCMAIVEQPTVQCPCFDNCFTFDWPGSSLTSSGYTSTSAPVEGVNLLIRTTGGGVSPRPSDPICGFVYAGTSTFQAWLWVDKATGRAFLRISCGSGFYYACTDFGYDGATMHITGFMDSVFLGEHNFFLGQEIMFDQLSDLPAWSSYGNGQVTDAEVPQTIEVRGIRCDGEDLPSQSGVGACGPQVIYVAATVNGALAWQYQSHECSNGCGPDAAATSLSLSGLYGYPTTLGETLEVPCVPIIHHAPVSASSTISLPDDTPYVFTLADFPFSDPHDFEPDNLLYVILFLSGVAGVANGPRGIVLLNDVPLSGTAKVEPSDIDDGNLTFVPGPGSRTNPYDTLPFQLQDDGGTAHGGSDTSATYVLTFNNRVNHAPEGKDAHVIGWQGQPYHFSLADFGFSDPDDDPPDQLYGILITTLPDKGTLGTGVAFEAGQIYLVTSYQGGVYLQFQGDDGPGEYGEEYTSFTFQVIDTGGTFDGGQDTDQTPRTITIDLLQVHNAPVTANSSITVPSQAAYKFKASDFPFSDPNDSPADQLLHVIFTTPTKGKLAWNGAEIDNASIPIEAVNNGEVTYTTDEDGVGSSYAWFFFQVQDDGGTDGGGADTSPRKQLYINATPNNPPSGTNNTINVPVGSSHSFLPGDFGFTDPDDDPSPHNFLNAIVTPGSGTLNYKSSPLLAETTIPVTDLAGGRLWMQSFVKGSFTFSFQVQDDGGTAGGGSDTSSSCTMTVVFS